VILRRQSLALSARFVPQIPRVIYVGQYLLSTHSSAFFRTRIGIGFRGYCSLTGVLVFPSLVALEISGFLRACYLAWLQARVSC